MLTPLPHPGDREHRPEEAVRVGHHPDHHQQGVDQDVDEQMTAKVTLLLESPDRLVTQLLLTVGVVDNHGSSLLTTHALMVGRPEAMAPGKRSAGAVTFGPVPWHPRSLSMGDSRVPARCP